MTKIAFHLNELVATYSILSNIRNFPPLVLSTHPLLFYQPKSAHRDMAGGFLDEQHVTLSIKQTFPLLLNALHVKTKKTIFKYAF